jgi:hypothetical protein
MLSGAFFEFYGAVELTVFVAVFNKILIRYAVRKYRNLYDWLYFKPEMSSGTKK